MRPAAAAAVLQLVSTACGAHSLVGKKGWRGMQRQNLQRSDLKRISRHLDLALNCYSPYLTGCAVGKWRTLHPWLFHILGERWVVYERLSLVWFVLSSRAIGLCRLQNCYICLEGRAWVLNHTWSVKVPKCRPNLSLCSDDALICRPMRSHQPIS